ncbi:MAG: carboxypeptidase regulatory-like domain-containing protein, partial [Thiohalocapsa sp.]
MGLLLGGGMLAAVGAQPMPAASAQRSPSDATMQLADASQNWAIRPAGEADPPMQSTDAAVSPSMPSADAGTLAIQTDGGIRYVSGGVGESERSDLQALSSQFNLNLMFATQGSGEYLSAVQVTILDANNAPVLSVKSKGPWFYAQLPPGDYRVEATPTGSRGEDQTQRKAVHLDGSN